MVGLLLSRFLKTTTLKPLIVDRSEIDQLEQAIARNLLLDLWFVINYWEQQPISSREKLQGLTHSTLSKLDAEFNIIPLGRTSDNIETLYSNINIAGYLGDNFYGVQNK